jgi:hypothetical protein
MNGETEFGAKMIYLARRGVLQIEGKHMVHFDERSKRSGELRWEVSYRLNYPIDLYYQVVGCDLGEILEQLMLAERKNGEIFGHGTSRS